MPAAEPTADVGSPATVLAPGWGGVVCVYCGLGLFSRTHCTMPSMNPLAYVSSRFGGGSGSLCVTGIMGPCATTSVGAGSNDFGCGAGEWCSSSLGVETVAERILFLGWPLFATARAQARQQRRTMSMARRSHSNLGGRRYSLTLPRNGPDVSLAPRSFELFVVVTEVDVGASVVVVSVTDAWGKSAKAAAAPPGSVGSVVVVVVLVLLSSLHLPPINLFLIAYIDVPDKIPGIFRNSGQLSSESGSAGASSFR
mmetsp:Transcript_77269/g.201372  ORF Transcript_77269/g.201372 Transcript_77269/m.201372 type:complete len:254 (+) Transcript_77269:456-1217(+)